MEVIINIYREDETGWRGELSFTYGFKKERKYELFSWNTSLYHPDEFLERALDIQNRLDQMESEIPKECIPAFQRLFSDTGQSFKAQTIINFQKISNVDEQVL